MQITRLLKNSEGNRNGGWIFCRRKEADVALFSQMTRMRMISKICEANLTIIAGNRKITKQQTLKTETNKTDRNPPISNHKP